MPDVTYEIVEHDGGWAYKVNGVFSEPLRRWLPAGRKSPATGKPSNTRMTRESGTRKPPVVGTGPTPLSGTRIELLTRDEFSESSAPVISAHHLYLDE